MDSNDPRAYLRRIAIVTPSGRYPLGGEPIAMAASITPPPSDATDAATKAPRQITLAGEAMRWTYVLRSRERWKGDERAVARHERSAIETMHAFGLGDIALKAIGESRVAMIQMPFEHEAEGWAGRIFPWEFVLASATRRFRVGGLALTVMRHLDVLARKAKPIAAPAPRVLFVQSQPGVLESAYVVDDEAALVRRSLGLDAPAANENWLVLKSPTLGELTQVVQVFKPEIVHIAGFDNHQGVRLIREVGGARSRVWFGSADGDQRTTVGEFLDNPAHALDGVLLRSEDGAARVTTPDELGRALTADIKTPLDDLGRALQQGKHEPYLVCLNVWNSAARTAPLLLANGALAALGFQDAFDDALAEYCFETFYSTLRLTWNLPAAFEQALAALRSQIDLGPGTGVVLWGRAPLVTAAPRELVAVPPRISAPPIECRIKAKKELNYSVLHNGGALFDEFELHNNLYPQQQPLVHLRVELHCGSEDARYESALVLDDKRVPLLDKIRIPLTASLMRSVSEAVLSSLYVEVLHDGSPVHKNTYPLRLLPVDQWLDNAQSGQWLPSFVLPRDPAVEAAIVAAQRYVRVIRDDPTAGFEGYQSADPNDPDSLEQIDLQVEAIWAALLHEWRLGYINPPPTYADTREGVRPLDSQRLRTPSTIRRAGMGTCIDLALLFAACLELVDIYPVIFLLEGHALPGYWRHHDYQAEYRLVSDPGEGEAVAVGDERRNTTPGAQTVPWRVGKSGFRELRRQIRSGRLVPLETVRLTEHSSFREAMKAGVEALVDEADFDSVLDIITARRPNNVTPLPILGES